MATAFTQKVETFFKDVGTDLSDAEKDVVAWFQHIFNKHKAGATPAAPVNQAGNTPPKPPTAAQAAAAGPTAPIPVNQNPAPLPAPNAQAGSGVQTPAPVTAPVVNGAVTPGIDTPDGNGLVGFTGLASGNKYVGQRVNIAEVVNSLPNGSQGREIGLQNLRIANDKFNVGDAEFIGVAYPAVQVKNNATGNMDWVINDESTPIANTTSYPDARYTYNGQSYDLGTVAGVIAMVNVAGMVPDRAPVQDNEPAKANAQTAASSGSWAEKGK